MRSIVQELEADNQERAHEREARLFASMEREQQMMSGAPEQVRRLECDLQGPGLSFCFLSYRVELIFCCCFFFFQNKFELKI